MTGPRELLGSGQMDRAYAPGELRGHVSAVAQAAQTEDELARNLRRERNRQQLRIIWRDITRQAAAPAQTVAEAG